MLGQVISGYQSAVFYISMLGRILKWMLIPGIIYLILANVAWNYYETPQFDRYITMKYWKVSTINYLSTMMSFDPESKIKKEQHMTVEFTALDNKTYSMSYYDFLNNAGVHEYVDHTTGVAIRGFFYILLSLIPIALAVFAYFLIIGYLRNRKKTIKGARLVTARYLKRILRRDHSLSDIHLGELPMIKNTETHHTMIPGTTGTGKTQLIKGILNDVQKRNRKITLHNKSPISKKRSKNKIVIYDAEGSFAKQYYRPGYDVILYPFDQRSEGWKLQQECLREIDLASVAKAIIPPDSKKGEDFFIRAARVVWAKTAQSLIEQGEYSFKKHLDALNSPDLDDAKIQDLVAGTEAAIFLDKSVDKMANSIRAVMMDTIRCLEKVDDQSKNPFVIREWAENDDDDRWVFILNRPDEAEYFKPLLSMWFDLVLHSILCLDENLDRRIWVIIDELKSLHTMPSLLPFLERARKRGGCGVFGFQGMSQLNELFGDKGAENFINLCKTKVCFSMKDDQMADKAARLFGEETTVETSTTMMYNINSTSTNDLHKKEYIISGTDIIGLPDLTAYIRLADGTYPTAKTKVRIVKGKGTGQPAFIEDRERVGYFADKKQDTPPEAPKQEAEIIPFQEAAKKPKKSSAPKAPIAQSTEQAKPTAPSKPAETKTEAQSSDAAKKTEEAMLSNDQAMQQPTEHLDHSKQPTEANLSNDPLYLSGPETPSDDGDY